MAVYPAGSAAIEIHPSLKGFRRDLVAELRKIDVDYKIDVHANTKTLAAEIETFRRTQESRPIDIPVRVDTKHLEAFKKSLSGAVLPNLGALAVGNLPAAATGVAALGSAIADLSGSALLLPAAFAGIGAVAATVTVGLQGMKDAFAEGEKGAEAFAKLGENAQRSVTSVKNFTDEWSNLQKSVQNNLFADVDKTFERLANTQLPKLQSGMEGVASSLNRGLLSAMNELASPASGVALDQVFGNTAKSTDILNGAVAPLITSFRTLATTGSTFLPQLAQGFTNLSERFDAFIQRSEASGNLSRWIQEGIDSAKTLGSILFNLGDSIASIIRATGDDGQSMLETFDRLTENLAAFLSSTEGQTQLATFFAEGKGQLEQWLPIIRDMGPLMLSVMDAARAWSDILMPFLQAASGLLADHPGLVQAALGAYLGFKTMAPILDGLRLATSGVTTGLDAMKRGAGDAAGAGGMGKMAGAASGLMGLFMGGGPWGIALGAGAAAIGLITTAHQNAAREAELQKQKEEELQATLDANTGKVTEQTLGAVAKDFQERGVLDRAESFGINTQALVRGSTGIDEAARAQITSQLAQTIQGNLGQAGTGATASTLRTAGISQGELAQALAGDAEAIDAFNAKMEEYQTATQNAGISLAGLRDIMPDAAESASVLGNELNGTADATGNAASQARQLAEAQQGTFELTEQGAQGFRDLGVAVRDVPDSKTVIIDAPTEDQQRRLEELGYTVTELPDGSFQVILNDEQARTAITELQKPISATFTLRFVGYDGARPDQLVAPQRSADYAGPGRAFGGPISGPGGPRDDRILIAASAGEYMQQASAVDYYGIGAMDALNTRRIPKELLRGFADGGLVDPQRAIAYAKSHDGEPYVYGGLDCSGYLSGIFSQLTGQSTRFVTNSNFPGMGWVSGFDPNGFSIGTDGGSGMNGHMAGTLYGVNVESDGSNGIQYGRTADGATAFPRVYHWPGAGGMEGSAQVPLPGVPDSGTAGGSATDSATQSQAADSRTSQQEEDSGPPESISAQAIGAKAGSIIASGILDFFGLSNSVLSETNVYNQAYNKTVAGLDARGKKRSGSGTATTTPSVQSSVPTPSTDPIQGAFAKYGWGEGEQWEASKWIIQKESGGNPKARNPQSGAYGLGQFLGHENDKYGAMGAYSDDPSLQAGAMAEYIKDRYGDPMKAKQFWEANGWYRYGGMVSGRGGPMDDANLIHASTGEWITNALSSAAAPALLGAVNSSPSLAGELDAQFRASAEWGRGGVSIGSASAGGRAGGSVTNFNFPGTRVANVEDLVELGERRAAMASIGALSAAPA